MLNELILERSVEGESETYKYYHENQLMLEADIYRFSTLHSFVRYFLIPDIIEPEYDYLCHSMMEELEELVANSSLEQWLALSNSDLKELSERLETDEFVEGNQFETMIRFLQLKNRITHNSELKGMAISSISSNIKGAGIGTELVNQYKAESDYIVLYSMGADVYWEKQGFKEQFNGCYIWVKDKKNLSLFDF